MGGVNVDERRLPLTPDLPAWVTPSPPIWITAPLPEPPNVAKKHPKWHKGAEDRRFSEEAAREMSQVEPKHIRNSLRSTDGHQNSALKTSMTLLAATWSKQEARFASVLFILICS